MHTFYFHEDDPGQVTIKPIKWWGYYAREFELLKAHDAEHHDPESHSWDQMYTPGKPDANLPKIKMSEQRFVELLSPHGKQYERIESNLSEFDTVRSVGFGPSRCTGVIADLDGDQVGWLWCMPSGEDAAGKKMMGDLLQATATDQHLLLADWRSHELVDLRDREAINRFLE